LLGDHAPDGLSREKDAGTADQDDFWMLCVHEEDLTEGN
jgi:hypothetical protein